MSAKITAALHAVMQEVGYVQKSQRNDFHKYNYAGESDLLEKLRPAMLKHGLLLIPSVTDVSAVDDHGNTTVRMEYTLAHKDGDVWPHPIGAAGTGNDKNSKGVGDKGTYKAITGANKYLLFKLFQIETGDDPESEVEPEPAPRPQREVVAVNQESDRLKMAGFKFAIRQASTLPELKVWWGDHQKEINTLPAEMQQLLADEKDQRKAELTADSQKAA